MTKEHRAQSIIDAVMAMDKEFGHDMPGGAPGDRERLIYNGPKWRARVIPDYRIAYVRRSQSNIVECVVAQAGCTFFELKIFDTIALQANVRGTDVQLHNFQPGDWEGWFGVDNERDTVPLLPIIFADPNSPAWQAFMKSEDYQLPDMTRV